MQHRRFCHIMCMLAAFMLSVPVLGQDDADSATCTIELMNTISRQSLPENIEILNQRRQQVTSDATPLPDWYETWNAGRALQLVSEWALYRCTVWS